ncbi:melanotransferrin-like isoform X1 [Rhopilema esculentum]|uniref:melanotransferrin-like isoform X1 n=1 Tax=Rhopilema esculentum TaxID=499914 RepID=UPI0031D8235F
MKLSLFLAIFTTLFAFAKAVPRWCAADSDKMAKCLLVKQMISNQMECVLGNGDADCYKKIANNEAESGVFRGPEIYQAGKLYDLRVFMYEQPKTPLPESRVGYYGIAMVKNTSSALNINNLKGKRSCHTGVLKNAGWVMPVGTLMSKGLMKCVNDNQYASVAAFFNASCAPGAKDPKYNPEKAGADNLCSLCTGAGSNSCVRSSAEPYYSHEGAFKCLKDGAGDVAFFKATILQKRTPAELKQFKILCLNGSQTDATNFAKCNLARAPARALLARNNVNLAEYQAWMQNAILVAGARLFDKKIFSDDTIHLRVVGPGFQKYDQYLDPNYAKSLEALDNCRKEGKKSANEARALGFNWLLLAILWCFCSLW